MKLVMSLLVCCSLVSSALAAPAVTEIRLKDIPGFVRPPRNVNEFVFRADGHFYWLEGTEEKPVRHQYPLSEKEFGNLVAALDGHHFFNFGPKYPTDVVIMDVSKVMVSATRGGEKKSVVDSAGFGSRPQDLWELEMILRGFASQRVGLKRTSSER